MVLVVTVVICVVTCVRLKTKERYFDGDGLESGAQEREYRPPVRAHRQVMEGVDERDVVVEMLNNPMGGWADDGIWETMQVGID